MPSEVTDPALLAKLNAPEKKPVTDPAVLAQLNGAPSTAADIGNVALNTAKQLGFAAVSPIAALGNAGSVGVQQLYRGVTGREHDESPYFKPFWQPEEYEPKTKGGAIAEAGANIVAPLFGAKIADAIIPTVAKPVIHPVETASTLFKTAGKAAKAVAKPVVRGIIEGENPITGEPGLKKALQSPEAKEGERLQKKLGIKFTAGELTGNPTARSIEDALANSARYGGRFAEANEKKTDAIIADYKKTLNSIYPKSVSRVDIGDRLSTAYKSTIDKLADARRTEAKADFALANKVAEGKPVIAPTHFINTLKSFIKEGDSPLATPAQQAASKQAKMVLDRLKVPVPKPSSLLDENGRPLQHPMPKEAYRRITIDDLQNGLALYGEGAHSSGGIWKGLATASDRRFAKAAKTSLEADMDAAPDDVGGTAAQALKIARDKYKLNSNKISDIEKTTLGKLVGNAEHDSTGRLVISPEKMADRFSGMEPTEIKSTLAFLDKYHPDVAQAARRYTLEKAFREALESTGQRGAGATKNFAKAQFVKSLPSDEKLNALLGNAKAATDVKDIAAAINRMIDWGASQKGSQTAQRTDMLASMAKWGKGAIYRSIISDSIVDDLLNPEMRSQLANNAKNLNKGQP